MAISTPAVAVRLGRVFGRIVRQEAGLADGVDLRAVCDEAGTWHGDPAAKIDWSEPKTGILLIPSEANSPFAGQRMTVRYAAMEGSTGFERLELEDGRRLYPTGQLEELLSSR